MASDKPEKKEKKKDKKEKKEKKEKLGEDGVKKSKSEKKEKKKKSKDVTDAIMEQLDTAKEAVLAPFTNGATEDEGEDAMDVDVVKTAVPVGALVPFANPLADEKQTKKLLKSVKKAAKNKTLKRGVKEVVKSLRKSPVNGPSSGNTSDSIGVVIIAADISPMDVISHIPVLCEDHNIPYIYVSSRAELGAAGNTKRATSVVMVSKERTGKAKDAEAEDPEYKEAYADLVKLVQKASKSVLI